MVAGATGIWMRVVMVAVMWVAATAEQAVPSATGARRHGVRRALFVEQAALLSRSPSRESLLCTEDLQGPWRRKDAALRLQQQPAATGVRRHASTLVFVEQHDLASALALPEEPHGVCRLKESVSERRRHLQGFNDEYGDETTMPYIHFVMDALEREKQSLQLRPDGVNIFLLSRRAWVKQGLPRERDSAVLPKQGQDSAWRRHQTPDHARAVTERCSKKNGTLAVFTQSGNSAPFFQHIRSYWLFLKIRNGSEGRMSLGLFC